MFGSFNMSAFDVLRAMQDETVYVLYVCTIE